MDDKRYQVFVSSTAQDLQLERQKIWENLTSLEYLVSGMESFPATDAAQFEYIKSQISLSDYYVSVIGGRYGTISDNNLSFTEREFHFAQEIGVPTLVFPIKDFGSLPVTKTDEDNDKRRMLDLFRSKACENRLCHLWTNADDLALGVMRALQNAVRTKPRPGWQRGNTTNSTELLSENRQLRLENEKLKSSIADNVSERPSAELHRELNHPFSFHYRSQTNSSENISVTISPKDILMEASLFEQPTVDLIEECLRGAIAVKTGIDYTFIEVDREETDRAILLLVKLKILKIHKSGFDLRVRLGEHWLSAHTELKLEGR